MGRIGRVLSYIYGALNGDTVADIKTDLGGGDNRETWHAEPANQTSRPLAQDLVVAVPVPGAGRHVAVAFIDPANPQDIEQGEHKTYARDGEGAVVCHVYLNAEGTVEVQATRAINLLNDNGYVNLGSSGEVDINGVIIDTSGNVTLPSGTKLEAPTVEGTESLQGAGVEHIGHTHGFTNADGIPSTTDPII